MDFQEAMEKRAKQYEEDYSLLETAAQGSAFEDLCRFYLEKGPWGKKTAGAAVWKWKDPGNPLRLNAKDEKDRLPQDTGCDRVAQTPDRGGTTQSSASTTSKGDLERDVKLAEKR